MSNQSNDPRQQPFDDDYSGPASDEKIWPPPQDADKVGGALPSGGGGATGDDAEFAWLEEAAELEQSMDTLKEMTSKAIEDTTPVELDLSSDTNASARGSTAKQFQMNAQRSIGNSESDTTATAIVDAPVNPKQSNKTNTPDVSNSARPVIRVAGGVNPRFRKSAEGELAQLWTNVFFSGELEPPKTVVVAAARQGDGATQIAASLAMLGAESNPELSICLVDVNLRRPGVANILGIDSRPGVTDVLAGRAKLEEALQTVSLENGTTLTVLSAGPAADHPLSFIKSRQLKSLIGQLRERFDHTIFDIASADRHPDAQAVGMQTDGVLVVVNAGSTSRETVAEARKRLDLAGARCLGLVLNQRNDPIPAMLYNVT